MNLIKIHQDRQPAMLCDNCSDKPLWEFIMDYKYVRLCNACMINLETLIKHTPTQTRTT